MLSHMQTMLVVFHSRGLVLTWIRTDSGVRESTSPSRVTRLTGARHLRTRQHVHHHDDDLGQHVVHDLDDASTESLSAGLPARREGV